MTGSAITLKQATAVAGTSEKALAFTGMWANTDVAAAPNTQTATAVASSTFTTNATNSKESLYIIEVDADTLDQANAFHAFQVVAGNATAATLDIIYILGHTARYGGGYNSFMNPLAD